MARPVGLGDCRIARLTAQVVPPRSGRPALVSVVLPTLGRPELRVQLGALASQIYGGPWEVVVSNNVGNDHAEEITSQFSGRVPSLRVIDSRDQPGAASARNAGVAASAGEFLAFCDDDDEVSPGWLAALVEAATRADMVGGPVEYQSLNQDRRTSGPAWRGDAALRKYLHFLPWACSANCGIWRSTLNAIGGWNENYRRCSDVELSWRLQLAGYTLAAAPDALVRYRFRSSPGAAMAQSFGWGVTFPRLYRDFRRHGCPRSRRVLRVWAHLAVRCPDVARGPDRRGEWFRLAAERAGRFIGSARYRVWYF
jgi:GT2 family glycosyltransferase